MAYLDYVGLAYFKSLLDENYLRTDYEGDTVINGNVTFTEPVNASVKNDWLGHQIDKTYIKDVTPDPEGSGALALILGDGTVSHLITDTTVTQVRSNANEFYPILLCYDASAEEDQIAKKVWYGNGVRINPRYGYFYSQKMFTLHPSYNRASAPTSRVEWTSDFRDSVLNPVGQIFEYIDPVSSGGEHRMEFRLYGNPNVAGINTPNVNDETNTISMGVSVTRGDTLTFFGYCPSTPIYLENGSTMRKSLTRGDQYGRDIITRDWLNLNGSITGLVHTYMDETIDGYKTFLKTVTIDSGNDNAKAGLNVQGNSHIHGNEDIDGNLNVDGASTLHGDVHMYNNLDVDKNANIDGNETIGGTLTITDKLTANGTAEIKGGSGNTPSLKVTGNETVTGDLSVGGSETVTGNISTTSGNISTTNGTVSGKTGSIGAGGLTVAGPSNLNGGASITGNETVSGNLTVSGTTIANDLSVTDDATIGDDLIVNGDANVAGAINKKSGNTTQEYVSYITNQQSTRETIINNMIKDKGGLAIDSNKEIYVKLKAGGGVDLDTTTGELFVNFDTEGADAAAQAAAQQIKNQLLASLGLQIPLTKNMSIYVDPSDENSTDTWRNSSFVIDTSVGTRNKPFKSINTAIECITSGYSLGKYDVSIYVMAYKETAADVDTDKYSISSGIFTYKESVSCPTYSRTSGDISLYPYSYKTVDSALTYVTKDYAYHVTINKGDNSSSNCISFAGRYNLYRFNLINNINYDCAVSSNSYPNIVSVSSSAFVGFRGCRFESKFLYPSHTHYVGMRPINVTGTAYFYGTLGDYPNEFYFSKGAASALYVIYMWEDSLVDFPYTNNTGEGKYMIAEGDCSAFIHCRGATVRDTSGQNYAQSFKRWEGGNDSFRYDYNNEEAEGPTVIDGVSKYYLVTGSKYSVSNGGHCDSVRGGFPGNANGTVSSETYSVYTGSSNNYDWNSSSPTGTIS